MGRTNDRQYLKTQLVNGGAAGDITVTGISTVDTIEYIFAAAFTINSATPADNDPIDLTSSVGDVTSEFSITAADTINNTGGTATTDNILFVTYWDSAG
jgi:hypothetical protein